MIPLALIIVAVQAGAVADEFRAMQDAAARCDLDGDGVVGSGDQGALLGAWTPRGMGQNSPADLTGDRARQLVVALHDDAEVQIPPFEAVASPFPLSGRTDQDVGCNAV